jgi:hypothetical protein
MTGVKAAFVSVGERESGRIKLGALPTGQSLGEAFAQPLFLRARLR